MIGIRILEAIEEKDITQIHLINKGGVTASFLTLGATWQEFLMATDNGEVKNLLLGFDV